MRPPCCLIADGFVECHVWHSEGLLVVRYNITVGQCIVGSQEDASYLLFVGGGQLNPTQGGCRISRTCLCGCHDSPYVAVPPRGNSNYCRPPGVDCRSSFCILLLFASASPTGSSEAAHLSHVVRGYDNVPTDPDGLHPTRVARQVLHTSGH